MAKRIMIVDDQLDVATVLGRLVEKCGATARVVNDGPAALAAAEEWKPDVVLIDLGLPTMDGYEVARRLRETPGLGEIRIVALTGNELDEEAGDGARFDRHLVKPIGVDVLREIIAE